MKQKRLYVLVFVCLITGVLCSGHWDRSRSKHHHEDDSKEKEYDKDSSEDEHEGGVNFGIIIAISVSAAFVSIVVVVGVICCCCKTKNNTTMKVRPNTVDVVSATGLPNDRPPPYSEKPFPRGIYTISHGEKQPLPSAPEETRFMSPPPPYVA